ncbi:MAG: hypothetical protein ACLFO6_04315 [Archaeoglobaceae archaeon]
MNFMPGMRIRDIERMHKLVDVFGTRDEGEEVQVWRDVGIFKELFPQDKSSVEILQELRENE